MKIGSNSIRSGISEVQQESNTTEAAKITKEVSPDTKSVQAAGQFAASIKSEQSFAAMMRATELQKTAAQIQTNPRLTEQIATVNTIPGSENKLQPLLDRLNSLVDQKKDLMEQIKSLTSQIMGAEVSGNQKDLAQAQAALQQLKSQLAQVDVEIKEVMTEIEKLQQQEQEEQDRAKNQNEQGNSISKNLDKAAESLSSIWDAIKFP